MSKDTIHQGSLVVKIVEGRDFLNKEIVGVSSPYASVTVADMDPRRTSVVQHDLNPIWNEEFKFEVCNGRPAIADAEDVSSRGRCNPHLLVPEVRPGQRQVSWDGGRAVLERLAMEVPRSVVHAREAERQVERCWRVVPDCRLFPNVSKHQMRLLSNVCVTYVNDCIAIQLWARLAFMKYICNNLFDRRLQAFLSRYRCFACGSTAGRSAPLDARRPSLLLFP